ncbi:MAG: hypothetical protein IKQ83_04805 [Lachnospiraceae bacterium]|nr:hypothetical protein [Lachnospiraceae bacterium]
MRINGKGKTTSYRLSKGIILCAAGILAGSVLTGCGSLVPMPELTEEQTELVTEYAAGLILKYDLTAVDGKLLTPEELAQNEMLEAQQRQRERDAKAAAEDYLAKKANAGKDKKNKSDSDSSSDSSAKAPTEQTVGDLADFYGMDGFDISYSGFEISDSYPTSGEDMLMAMDATAGKTLCVLKFNVTNSSGADATFDMFYRSPNFYLSINGGEKVHHQYTLLLDDMAASNDPVAAGETIERVLIFEIPEDVGSVSSLSLQAKNAEGVKGTMNLQ